MARPTRLEAGHRHLLAYCTSCPSWRRLAGSRPEALRREAEHLQLVHGLHKLARKLRSEAARLDRDTPS